MRALVSTFVAISVAAAAAGAGAGKPAAAPLCVGADPGCYATIQSALDAAADGDRISVGPGTYAGGLVIAKSVSLEGAGATATTIAGGGPVVTIGVLGASAEPTVSISGVTIRDGVNATDPTFVVGGGVLIPAAAGGSTGATVTIVDSVITANRATPTVAAPIGPPCPGGRCGFAEGDGGGIANWGTLTLLRTTVSGNEAGGPVASDAHGGGIWTARVATLTLRDSAVTGNLSGVVAPNGRFAIGGGVHVQNGGGLEIEHSVVDGNTASLASALPGGIDMIANGGGIHVGDGSDVTIEHTRIDGNSVVVDDPAGQPSGFDAGIIVGTSTLSMRHTTVEGNRVEADVAATDDNGPSGGAVEIDGSATIEHVRITDNPTTVTSHSGNAEATGALGVFGQDAPTLIADSLVAGNTVTVSATGGAAKVEGAGIVNGGLLELRNVRVVDNAATAAGPSGFARGAGIWNGALFGPPPVELTLERTTVTGNTLSAGPGLTAAGAGLFTDFPVTLDHSRIERNTPDDCSGC